MSQAEARRLTARVTRQLRLLRAHGLIHKILTPAASPVDGLFDVFVMGGASKREVLTRPTKRHLRARKT